MSHDQSVNRRSAAIQRTEAAGNEADRLAAAAALLAEGRMNGVTVLLGDGPLSIQLRSIKTVRADEGHFDWLYAPKGYRLERVSEAALAAMALDYVVPRSEPLMAQLRQLAESGGPAVEFAGGTGGVIGYSVLDLAAGMPWLIRDLLGDASKHATPVAAAVERRMERIAAHSAVAPMGEEEMDHLGHIIMALGENGCLPGEAALQTHVTLRDRHADEHDVHLSRVPFLRAFPSWMTDAEVEPLSAPTVLGSLWAWLAAQGATRALEAAHALGHDLDEPSSAIRAINAALCGTSLETIAWLVAVGADTEPVRVLGPDVEADAVAFLCAARAQRVLTGHPQHPATRPL